MNPLLQVLFAAGWLFGLLPLPALMPGSPPAAAASTRAQNSIFTCDASQPFVADFDANGVLDVVGHVDDSGRAGLRVLVNGSQQIHLHRKSACRFGIIDLDHDRDADLVVLSARGRLHVWRNDNGKLHRVRPRRSSHRDAVRNVPSMHGSGAGIVLVAFAAGAPIRPSRSSIALAITARVGVRESRSHQASCQEPYAARPPPAFDIL
jgi:hypothetical protein